MLVILVNLKVLFCLSVVNVSECVYVCVGGGDIDCSDSIEL